MLGPNPSAALVRPRRTIPIDYAYGFLTAIVGSIAVTIAIFIAIAKPVPDEDPVPYPHPDQDPVPDEHA